MDYTKVVILVVFYLVTCSASVTSDDELICPVMKWGIGGERFSIVCHSNVSLSYVTLTKIHDDGVNRSTIVTVDPKNQLIFYKENEDHKERVKVLADMLKGNVSFTIVNALQSDSGSYELSYKRQQDVLDGKLPFNITILDKPRSPEMTLRANKTAFYKEDNITIHCSTSANPPAHYWLYLNNNKLAQKNSSDEFEDETKGVFPVKLTLEGLNTFTCVPYNEFGIGQNQTLSIFVQDNLDKLERPTKSRVKLEMILPIIAGCLVVLFGAVILGVLLRRRTTSRS